ncbi:hypothetical protein JCM8097_001800 [Rhodosporidiobolus ruineniae]
MGFLKDLLLSPDERARKKAAKQAKLAPASITTDTLDTDSTAVDSYGSEASQAKRSSSPTPPLPALPGGLPSDAFTLQETILIRKERELAKQRDRLERARSVPPKERDTAREPTIPPQPTRPHPRDAPPAGFSLSYSGANSLRADVDDKRRSPTSSFSSPSPTTRSPTTRSAAPRSPSVREHDRDPLAAPTAYRPTGLVSAAPAEERESIASSVRDDSSSTHRFREKERDKEMIRDYEAAMSRQMERLGSTSSIGASSVVSGLSGTKGWAGDRAVPQPFQNTVDDGAEKLRVIIVGSGFAGLAAAIACSRQGYQVTVVERGSGLSPHGDLITLGSNCTRILARWGLFPDLWKRSAQGGHWLLKSHTGEMLGGQDLRDFPQVYGAPLMQGHRAQYLGVLGVEARMQQVAFKPNTEVVEYRDDDIEPSIVTARGEMLSADLIIVCDGVNSYGKSFLAPELGITLENLRRPPTVDQNGHATNGTNGTSDSNGGMEETTPSAPEVNDEGKQYSVHRAAMMADRLRDNPKTAYFLDGCMRTFLGLDSHLKLAPLDNSRQISFTYLSRSRYTASTNWRDRRPVKEVTDTLEAEGWDESVVEAVKAFRTCLNWAVSEGAPSDKWTTESGKVILIGDAVHALSPLSFQGGSQAVEDGAALATCLALSGGRPEDVSRATRAFEAMRKARVAEAQVRGTKQRLLWHSYFDTQSPHSLDLNITEAYHHDAELDALARFERVVQTQLGDEFSEPDFRVDSAIKKMVLKRLEVGGVAQREAEEMMRDPDELWQNGGVRPAR